MATARPFTYNPDAQIPGTEKFGNLSVGFPTSGFESTGLQWWNGPDEDLGYVIAQTNVDINGNPQQPTPVIGQLGNVGFFRTQTKDDNLFVSLSNVVTGQNFTTPSEAKTWLESNEYWTSYLEITTTTTTTPPTGLVLNLDANNYIGSGNWLDTSGNNNDATLIQTPTYSSNEGGYFDLDGGAITATGQVDSFSIPDDNTLDTMTEISIEMWININSIDGTSGTPNMLFSKRGTNTNGYVGFFTNSQFLFRIGTSSPNQISWSTTPSTSVWQQIVVTVGSTGSKIYQNGVEVASGAYTGNFTNIDTSANLVIGDINPNNSGIRGFNGKMSVFKTYNTILSSGDILSNFDSIKNRYGL
jgi:hypothetical protein